MSDSDKESDPQVCPIDGVECIQREHIVALEAKVEELTKVCAELCADRKESLSEITTALRTLNAWAPTVDKGMDRLLVRTGEVAQLVSDLSDGQGQIRYELSAVKDDVGGLREDVTELQTIVKNGNGHAKEGKS